MPDHDPYAALRLGPFRRYLAGNVVSTLGQQMQEVAVGWELYERTGSALALGLVGLAQFVPLLALTLPAGHTADRYDRRRVLITAELVSAAAALGLASVSATGGPVALFYVCLTANGAARAFQGPAKSALLPAIVPRTDFPNAVTWNSGGWQLAAVLGPALGGLLLATVHRAAPVYALNALFCLLFSGLLPGVLGRPSPRAGGTMTLDALVAGVRFVARTKTLLASITLDLFAVLLGGATTLLPIYARDILRVGPSGLGWLLAAPSLGAVATAAVLAHRPPLRRAGRDMLLAVAGFGAATAVFGLSRSYGLSLAMLVVAGAFDNVSVVVRGSLVQLLTPDEMRGRVSAVNSVFIGTSNELGGFESGAVAALVGPVASVVAGGIGTLCVVAVVAARWPQLRRLRRLDDLRIPETTAEIGRTA